MDEFNKQLKLYNAKLIANKKRYIENADMSSNVVTPSLPKTTIENATIDDPNRINIINEFLKGKFNILSNSNADVVTFIMTELADNEKENLYSYWRKFEDDIVSKMPTKVTRNMFVTMIRNFLTKETGACAFFAQIN
jgi:hypothetical protein